MNGGKIALLTMLIVFLILIVFAAVFARYALDIEFADLENNDSNSVENVLEEESETQEPSAPENTSAEEQSQKTDDKENEDNKESTDDKGGDKEEDKKEEKDLSFKTESVIKTASVELKGDKPAVLKIEKEEQLQQLLNKINALQFKKIGQSVAMQKANWEAVLNLTMEDGASYKINLYDSIVEGSKSTLNDGKDTFESEASLEDLKGFLQEIQDSEVSKVLEDTKEYFDRASRVLLIDIDKVESSDTAASKATVMEALGKLKITETHEGRINPGKPASGINLINLGDKDDNLISIEFYETGVMVYHTEAYQVFYVCEANSLSSFYSTMNQLAGSYSAVPAHLALMNRTSMYSMEVVSNAGKSRHEAGLIRDWCQNLFDMLRNLRVTKNNLRTETQMYKKPDYSILIEFDNNTSYEVNILKGAFLLKDTTGTIYHYTLVGDDNLQNLKDEIERLAAR